MTGRFFKSVFKTIRCLIIDLTFITALWLIKNNNIFKTFKKRREEKDMANFKETNKKIEKTVVDGYKKIENGVTDTYKKVEDTFVSGYKNIEDKFVETFLTEEGETVEDAKKRLNGDK